MNTNTNNVYSLTDGVITPSTKVSLNDTIKTTYKVDSKKSDTFVYKTYKSKAVTINTDKVINDLSSWINKANISDNMDLISAINKICNIHYNYPLSIECFISDNYINITKGLIKSMASKNNVDFCCEIRKKGYYGDPLFYDLCQEVALVLLNNKDKIVNESITNNGITTIKWSIPDDTIINCLRAINKYGYKNKNIKSNTVVAATDLITRVDSKGKKYKTYKYETTKGVNYKAYCFKQFDNMEKYQYEHFVKIINLVKHYIVNTEKSFISDKCQDVLNLVIKGYKNKDIATELDISINSVTKYRNICNNAFYMLFKKPKVYNDNSECIKVLNDYINVCYSKGTIKIFENKKPSNMDYIPPIIDIINKRNHLKLQAIYNNLFGSIDNTCINKNNNYDLNTISVNTRGINAIYSNGSHYKTIIKNQLAIYSNNASNSVNTTYIENYNVNSLMEYKNNLINALNDSLGINITDII